MTTDDIDFVHLWTDNYYDGPLTGWGALKGSLVHFRFLGEEWVTCSSDEDGDPECSSYRTYELVEPTQQALLKELDRHRDFQMMVGFHWDYRGIPVEWSEGRGFATSHHGRFLNAFYERYPSGKREEVEGKVIGVYTEEQLFSWSRGFWEKERRTALQPLSEKVGLDNG